MKKIIKELKKIFIWIIARIDKYFFNFRILEFWFNQAIKRSKEEKKNKENKK